MHTKLRRRDTDLEKAMRRGGHSSHSHQGGPLPLSVSMGVGYIDVRFAHIYSPKVSGGGKERGGVGGRIIRSHFRRSQLSARRCRPTRVIDVILQEREVGELPACDVQERSPLLAA